MYRSRLFGSLILIAIASLPFACSDDNPTKPGRSGIIQASLSGHVTLLYDSIAVGGASMALVQGVPYRVVAGPVTSDADGYFEFTNPPPGDWYLFAFTDSLLMFDAADARVSIGHGSRITRDVEMIRSELWGGGGQFITGTVTDAKTGQPIEGAYVSGFFGSVSHDFGGVTFDAEGLTGPDGRYSVAAMNLILTSPFRAIHPLGVSKEGYAPFYMMDVPVPDSPDSIYVLDITLERSGSGATIRGRVVDSAGSLASVPVALDYVDIPLDTLWGDQPPTSAGDAQNVPLLGSAVRTDALGRFEIGGLVPGTYFIDAAYLPDDGYVTTYDEAGTLEIQGSEVIDAGDIHVVPALVPLWPANGQVVGTRPSLSWRAVPGADRYRLAAGTGHFLDYERDIVGSTFFAFDFEIGEGTHVRWVITAFKTATPYDEVIAKFEAPQTFTVQP